MTGPVSRALTLRLWLAGFGLVVCAAGPRSASARRSLVGSPPPPPARGRRRGRPGRGPPEAPRRTRLVHTVRTDSAGPGDRRAADVQLRAPGPVGAGPAHGPRVAGVVVDNGSADGTRRWWPVSPAWSWCRCRATSARRPATPAWNGHHAVRGLLRRRRLVRAGRPGGGGGPARRAPAARSGQRAHPRRRRAAAGRDQRGDGSKPGAGPGRHPGAGAAELHGRSRDRAA